MEIKAKITGIKYQPFLIPKLQEYSFSDFNINNASPYCIVKFENFTCGLSKWVSPKRTRSYPYERVYNTLGTGKRITVIPVIKDEGKNGDRDFIQWDTVSLMSLLDVFVIFAYYNDAEKHKSKQNKITNQKFDNEFVKQKIIEIKNYHSSALHWNLKEIEHIPSVIDKSLKSYKLIGEQLNVQMHDERGIISFKNQFINGVEEFKNTSREKAISAQKREMLTIQPKESLNSFTKSKITIENYLGGKYYFTVDEIKFKDNKLYLIESKHSKNSIIPSIGDIKDGLLKMILYTNLKEVYINNKKYPSVAVLKLTSPLIKKEITTQDDLNTITKLKNKEKMILNKLFQEANENNFMVSIENAN